MATPTSKGKAIGSSVGGGVVLSGGGTDKSMSASTAIKLSKYSTPVSLGGGGGRFKKANEEYAQAEAKRLAEEEAKRQEELRIKQEEARKLQAQLKAEREKKIESQKISGQVKTNQVNKYIVPEKYSISGGKKIYNETQFVGSDPNAITVYTRNNRTTGRTNIQGFDIGSGLNPFSLSFEASEPQVESITRQSLIEENPIYTLSPSLQPSLIPTGTKIIKTKRFEAEVYTKPTVVQRQTGSFLDKETGRDIPITETVYIDPFGQSLGGGAYISTERPATKEETQELVSSTRVLDSSNAIASSSQFERRNQELIGETKQGLYSARNQINEPITNLLNSVGATDENLKKSSDILTLGSPLRFFKPTKDISSDFVFGLAKNVRDNPTNIALTYGVGVGLGFVARGTPILVGSLVKGGGYIKTGMAVERGLTYSITGASVLFGGGYALNEGSKIINADKPFEQLGKSSLDFVAFGAGFNKGGEPFDKKFYSSFSKPVNNIAQDIIQPISSEGRIIEVGQFQINTVVPKRVIYSDRPIKGFLRDLGIDNKYTGMKVEKTVKGYEINTMGNVITENGKIIYGQAFTGRKGKSLKIISLLEGKQENLDIQGYILGKNKLTNVQEYQLNKLTKGVFNERINYFVGELRTTKAVRRSQYNNYLNLRTYPYGKRSNLYSTISLVKEAANVEGKYDIYFTKLGIKDISKPLTRARGEITKVEGESIVLEPKIVNTADEFVFKRFSKTPEQKLLSKQNTQKSIVLIQQAKAQSIMNINARAKANYQRQIQSMNNKNSQDIFSIARNIERGNVRSAYYGTGKYEYQESQTTSQATRIKPIIRSSLISIPDVSVRDISLNIDKTINRSLGRSIDKTIDKTLNKEITKEIQKPFQKTIQKQQQKTIQKQLQKTIQKNARNPFRPLILPKISAMPVPPLIQRFKLRGKSKRKDQILKQPTKYQPSFTASILDIRRKKAGKFAGGLSVRPIVPDPFQKRIKRKIKI